MRKFNSLAEVDELEVSIPFIGLVDDKENGVYESIILTDEETDRLILKVNPETKKIYTVSAYPENDEIWIYSKIFQNKSITIPNYIDASIVKTTRYENSGRTVYKLNRDINPDYDLWYTYQNDEGLSLYIITNNHEIDDNGIYDEIRYPNNITYIKDGIFFMECSFNNFIIPKSLTSLPRYILNDCISLTSITIPDSVKEIGESAFNGCKNLKSVNIPEGVKNINDSTFSYCESLTSITIPDSVTYIGDCAFEGCTSLKLVNIPNGVQYIGDNAFDGCTSLKSITIPDSVTFIGQNAFNGSGIEYLEPMPQIDNIDYTMGMHKLKSFEIPSTINEINDSNFRECFSLTSINIPNSVVRIGEEAFKGCINISSITIPDSVAYIGYGAFRGCVNLHEIVIPRSATYIDSQDTGYNISKIIFLRTTPPEDNGLVSSFYQNIMGIFVPDESLSDYKEYYSSYDSKIFPISVLPNADEYYERIGIENENEDEDENENENEPGVTTQTEI